MNILFISPPPSLPNTLHRIRSYLLIKSLAKKHNVHLLAVTTDKKESQYFKELRKYCTSVTILHKSPLLALLHCLLNPLLPSEVAYCKSNEANQSILAVIKNKKIDLIYAKRLRSVVFLPETQIPIIVDTTDAMSMFYNRMHKHATFSLKGIFYYFEYLRYLRYEKLLLKKYNHWIICSEVDKKYIQTIKQSSNATIDVIPNPVDTTHFKPQRQNPFYDLLFRGLMDKPVNIDAALYFVKEIFPILLAQYPLIKLCIVGPDPVDAIKKLHDGKNIFVTGFVEDMAKIIAQSRIIICPVRIGSGTRHKVLQAWAMKKPVVSTTLGTEGLAIKRGENILIADTPKSFAINIKKLLQNATLTKKISNSGYNTLRKNYDLKGFENILTQTIKQYEKK